MITVFIFVQKNEFLQNIFSIKKNQHQTLEKEYRNLKVYEII